MSLARKYIKGLRKEFEKHYKKYAENNSESHKKFVKRLLDPELIRGELDIFGYSNGEIENYIQHEKKRNKVLENRLDELEKVQWFKVITSRQTKKHGDKRVGIIRFYPEYWNIAPLNGKLRKTYFSSPPEGYAVKITYAGKLKNIFYSGGAEVCFKPAFLGKSRLENIFKEYNEQFRKKYNHCIIEKH